MGFIDSMRRQGHAVESVCRVLCEQGCQVAARTYRAWRRARPSTRDVADAYVMNAVLAACYVWKDGVKDAATPVLLYGRRKMLVHLRRQGVAVSHTQVARCLNLLGHKGIRRAKTVRTTVQGSAGVRADDLLGRNFTAPAPDTVWVTDFTYVRTWAGFVYVAFILDVYSRRIVAWHAATSKHTDLVMTPLRMALWQRARDGHPVQAGTLIHHSDAGSQYTSIRLTGHLELAELAASIGSVGDALDNAMMESGNGLYKTECIRTTIFHQGPYKTLADVEFATAAWVDWYNHDRLHSGIGMVPPVEYEQAHYAALKPEPQPA